jgi:hypothetical protein
LTLCASKKFKTVLPETLYVLTKRKRVYSFTFCALKKRK